MLLLILLISVARVDSKGNTARSTLTIVGLTRAYVAAPALTESIHLPAYAYLAGRGRDAKLVQLALN